jgi:hypothetical protein
MIAGGASFSVSAAAWAVLAAKSVAAVLYVRARLRRARGLAPARVPVLAVHASAVGLAVALAAAGSAPRVAVLLFAVLLARAAYGLTLAQREVRPKVVGFQEMGYGIAFVLALALGYRLGL